MVDLLAFGEGLFFWCPVGFVAPEVGSPTVIRGDYYGCAVPDSAFSIAWRSSPEGLVGQGQAVYVISWPWLARLFSWRL